MPMTGFRCKFGSVPFDKCLSECPDRCVPKPFIWAVIDSMEDRKGMISASSIIQCLRKTYYEQTIDYSERLARIYPAFRGTMFHAIFERYPEKDMIMEKRFSREINGVKLSGKPDLIDPSTNTLWDWKTTKSVPCVHFPGKTKNCKCDDYQAIPSALAKAKERKWALPPCQVVECKNPDNHSYAAHGSQLNIYRWILKDCTDDEGKKHSIQIDHMKDFYLDMSNIRILEVPMDDTIEEFIQQRVPTFSGYLEQKKLPPAEAKQDPKSSWLCGFCPFTRECAEGENK